VCTSKPCFVKSHCVYVYTYWHMNQLQYGYWYGPDILIEMPQLIVHFNIHNMFRQLVHVSATSVLGCVLDASEQAASPRSNLAMILFQ